MMQQQRQPAPPPNAIFASTIGRCSLVRVAFRVVAEGRTHGNLADMALRNRLFKDLMTTGDALPTWSLRLGWYGIHNIKTLQMQALTMETTQVIVTTTSSIKKNINGIDDM